MFFKNTKISDQNGNRDWALDILVIHKTEKLFNLY